ncbi:MAG: diaminopimelate epimerase [Desulfobacterales bacterium]|nr:diaminopimelate epimerase [Desulfobacterales bacterium]
MRFDKYHGLGNDYVVMDPAECGHEMPGRRIRLICHRNYGLGADGILLGPFMDEAADAGVRIFNPDGSEAEKSGNGLRIFARYLWDRGMVKNPHITIKTAGGIVHSRKDASGLISVDMGKITFLSDEIPVAGPSREVIQEEIRIGETPLTISAAGIGNPHCVILKTEISEKETRALGPQLETHALFPNRTNVQFVKPLDRSNIRIEIWERGAGYTLASGSSSAAAAAVAHRLGVCDPDVTVHMPGGNLTIHINPDQQVSLKGPVIRVAEGVLHAELFDQQLPEQTETSHID